MSENQSLGSNYRELVRNAAGFSAEGFEEFVAFAAQYHPSASNEKAEIVDWLSAANRQADLVPLEVLLKGWIPYAYHSRTGEVSWCLPQGRAVQPFHDEYISHCRQYLVNALISPRISVDNMLRHADALTEIADPAGFIFHLSRCGSTLVSGCLAQLEQCSVLSESPLLTEILLDKNLPELHKKSLLRLCLQWQGRPSLAQPYIIVKWNAWDIFYWPLIRGLYPQVPVLFLTRDPVEILASHAKSAGRHMSGEPALGHVHPAFCSQADTGFLQHRIQVLQEIMTRMYELRLEPDVLFLDYMLLHADKIQTICRFFDVPLTSSSVELFHKRFARHSKQPDKIFHNDVQEKRESLSEDVVREIKVKISDRYQKMLCMSASDADVSSLFK